MTAQQQPRQFDESRWRGIGGEVTRSDTSAPPEERNLRLASGRIEEQAAVAGVIVEIEHPPERSRLFIERIVANPANKCRRFLWKSHPENQSGRLLLHLPDLINFFTAQAEQAQASLAALEEIGK